MPAHDPAPPATFHLGLNYPWHGYGWDFGPTPYGEGLLRREREAIERALDTLAASKITLLRWFVLSDGRNLPSPGGDVRKIANVRTYDGLGSFLERTADDETFHAAIGPRPAFVEDLVTLAGLVSARGMKLLPTFLSSTFLTPAEPAHVRDDFVARGRTSFVFGNEALPRARLISGYASGVEDTSEDIGDTREAVQAFVTHALAPLVEALPREAVFAWDVMNEPEWCIRGTPYTLGHAGALVHPWMALTFLNAALRCVARRGHDVSIGFVDGHVDAWFPRTAAMPSFARWLDRTLEGFPDVTYYHQHHYYPRWAGNPDDPATPPKPLADVATFGLGDRPVLLGEYQMRFAAGLSRGAGAAADVALRKKVAVWPDAKDESEQGRYLEARLALAKACGYAGALGWAGPGDPANGQSPYADGAEAVSSALSQLARFAISR